jgi:hypothetical protein
MIGALVLRMGGTARGVRPFITAGAGVSASPAPPTVTLTGRYSFISMFGAPFSETDTVTVRYGFRPAAVAMIGGGLTRDLGARVGIRLDARVHVGQNRLRTMLEARPVIAQQFPPVTTSTLSVPALQFTNNTASTNRSSLGGLITDFATFESRGWTSHVGVTAGWYVRF